MPDLSNIAIHFEYNGIDDGTGLIATRLLYPILHVPTIQKNLIFVHAFNKYNNVLIAFHRHILLWRIEAWGDSHAQAI